MPCFVRNTDCLVKFFFGVSCGYVEQNEQSNGTFTLPHLNFWGASVLFVRDVDWTTCPPGDLEASKQT